MTSLEPPPILKTNATRPVLLIVDDEAGPRESLRIVFKDRYQCALATCGREGIEYALANPVDAAILDIKMPDLTGIEVLCKLKEIDPDIECVMLTGYETVETARAAIRHGAADYLNKPFDVFAIRDIVEACLVRRQSKRDALANLQNLQHNNGELARILATSDRANVADVLSAGVVHELNNPLAIIAGYIQLLDRDLAKLTSNGTSTVTQDMLQRLAAIQREIQRSKEMAERFLRFSRSPRNEFEPVEVATLLDDIGLLLRAHPAGKSVCIVVQHVSASLRIQANSVEIMQVLMNLGINALQSMKSVGTVHFHAERADSPPANCVCQSSTYNPQLPHVRISIADNGCGIAPEDIKKIFVPHFTTKKEGNGFGLAVVAELLNKHSGAVEVISAVEQGSTFNVYLPLAA
jgi:signal transduction histidine kinase